MTPLKSAGRSFRKQRKNHQVRPIDGTIVASWPVAIREPKTGSSSLFAFFHAMASAVCESSAWRMRDLLWYDASARNVRQLWAAVHRLLLYEAAQNLARTFQIELTRTEKRNPSPSQTQPVHSESPTEHRLTP